MTKSNKNIFTGKQRKSQYVTKGIPIQAHPWEKNGDHPLDDCKMFVDTEGNPFGGEGKVVRYYRNPGDSGERICEKCGKTMHEHGWIDQTPSQTVCPGNWIVNHSPHDYFAFTQEEFDNKFEKIER